MRLSRGPSSCRRSNGLTNDTNREAGAGILGEPPETDIAQLQEGVNENNHRILYRLKLYATSRQFGGIIGHDVQANLGPEASH